MPTIDHAKWDFTLRQLSIFARAARTGSFARAADQLGISQPAVSRCIATLEARLQRTLFDRRNGSASMLSRDGADLLELAEAVLNASETIRANRGDGAAPKQRVRLCIGPMLRDLYLKPMMPKLYRDHPEIDLELAPLIPLPDVGEALDKGRVDLVVYTIGRPMEAWPNARLIGEVPVVMVGPPGTGARIASGAVQIEDLPLILPSASGLSENWIERQLAARGIRTRQRVVYLDFPDVIRDMVAQGLGVSVLMLEQVAAAIAQGRLELFGPALPTMRRVIMRSPQAGPAARIVEDCLASVLLPDGAGMMAPEAGAGMPVTG